MEKLQLSIHQRLDGIVDALAAKQERLLREVPLVPAALNGRADDGSAAAPGALALRAPTLVPGEDVLALHAEVQAARSGVQFAHGEIQAMHAEIQAPPDEESGRPGRLANFEKIDFEKLAFVPCARLLIERGPKARQKKEGHARGRRADRAVAGGAAGQQWNSSMK